MKADEQPGVLEVEEACLIPTPAPAPVAPRVEEPTAEVRNTHARKYVTVALLLVMVWSGVAAAETKLGVMADAGVPDGATASIVFRPVSALRLHGGVAYNTISTGAFCARITAGAAFRVGDAALATPLTVAAAPAATTLPVKRRRFILVIAFAS